ncbi:hypothetical protein Ahy_A02g005990 [Arachis hypogaea]|uniref:Uncharacterized protein n=1 Tax=Arachis hypogaea TaxID=3818 RepID=A0A445E8Y3_ARAHY|nr:hypothetical protein Ahy_A02g005990 [Arachis hypogaea]
MFRSSFLLLKKNEPSVHVQETIITVWIIRHPTRNRNDPIGRTELYQLSYILSSQVEHFTYKKLSIPSGQLDIRLMITTIQFKERSSTNRAISSRARWSMPQRVSLLFFFLAQLGHPGLKPETSLVKHPTCNSNDPIARAVLYQLSYILPSQLVHPRLKPETSFMKDLASEVNHRTYGPIQQIGRESIDFFSGAIHPFRTQHTTIRCTALSKIPYKKILEEPPTPTIVHVRSLLDLTNYVSYLLYVIDMPFFGPLFHYIEKVSHVHVQETIITAWTIRHPTRNSNDPIARAKFYQMSYILPDQVEHA